MSERFHARKITVLRSLRHPAVGAGPGCSGLAAIRWYRWPRTSWRSPTAGGPGRAEDPLAKQRPGWRNAKHARDWPRSLCAYTFPRIVMGYWPDYPAGAASWRGGARPRDRAGRVLR